MKYTFEEFQNYLMSEVKKIAINEGWGKKYEDIIDQDIVTLIPEKIVEEFEIVNLEKGSNDLVAEATEEKSVFNVNDIKSLNEELKRMKELVDFRNPLLNENSLK